MEVSWYVLKNEARASAAVSVLLGSWKKIKGWLKESVEDMNRRKLLMGFNNKGCADSGRTYTGIAEPS